MSERSNRLLVRGRPVVVLQHPTEAVSTTDGGRAVGPVWLAEVSAGCPGPGGSVRGGRVLPPSTVATTPYLVLTKPLRLDIQCQRGASVKIGCEVIWMIRA